MKKIWVQAAIVVLLTLGLAPAALALTFQQGDTGDSVRRIQRELGITDDGVYGQGTENAVLDFQRRRGLQQDGIAGPETLRALGLDDLASGSSDGSSSLNPYVVVVPGNSVALLNRVEQITQNPAMQARSNRGSYIRAGAFSQRSRAEDLSDQLRRNGLDARVAYRPATTAR